MQSAPRRLVVSEYLSLDGVMEEPQWTAPYWTDEIAAFKRDELFAADALLLGRVTYEGFAQAWPGMSGEDGFADRMNALPKHVVTATLDQRDLDETGWNGHLVGDDRAASIRTLKATPGGDLLVFGSADLVRLLVREGLVDAYHLLVYPVVLGTGKRLFDDEQAALRLVEARSFGSGVTALTYEPDPAA